jgi:hypothetical protein
MPTLREMLQPRRDIERRAVGRTKINRDVLMFFAGQDRVHACCVRDVTNHGAGLRLDGLNIVPFEFGISFDNFRTMRRCRLMFRCSEQMKFYRRGSREVWSTKKLPVPRDQGVRCRQPPRSSSQCLKIG